MAAVKSASRYAKALLDLSIEKNSIDDTSVDIKLILDVCKNSPDFVLLLNSPIVSPNKKSEIVSEIFKNKISELSLGFIQLLVQKRRESGIEVISKEFANQYNQYKKIQKALVTTAFGIDEDIRKKVNTLIKSEAYSEVELIEKIDPTLIGGFTLTIGDKQIDASVARSLKKIKQNLN